MERTETTEPEETAETLTIDRFIERHGITLTWQSVPENPHWTGKDVGAAHYFCTLATGGRKMTLYYSKGSGLRVWRKTPKVWGNGDRPKDCKPRERAPLRLWRMSMYNKEAFENWTDPEPPTVAEVLDCLASDASSVDGAGSFEDWASDLGFDSDSRKAEDTYRATAKQANELRRLLGPVDYRVLLENVELL